MKLSFWGGLGDEVCITGLVRELRYTYPHERLTVDGVRYPELFWHNPHLQGGAMESGQEFRLPPAPNDLVGNLVHAYAQFVGLPYIRSGDVEVFLLDAEREEARKALQPDGRAIVAMDTWAFWPRKRWPFMYFSKLVGLLQARGFRVVEVGSTYPDVFGERRTHRLPLAPEDCLLDLHSIRQTAAILGECHAYVGNGSGLAHLACAVDIPAVTIFSTPWWARAHRQTIPVFSLEHDCTGCTQRCELETNQRCLAKLPPELVAAVVP